MNTIERKYQSLRRINNLFDEYIMDALDKYYTNIFSSKNERDKQYMQVYKKDILDAWFNYIEDKMFTHQKTEMTKLETIKTYKLNYLNAENDLEKIFFEIMAYETKQSKDTFDNNFRIDYLDTILKNKIKTDSERVEYFKGIAKQITPQDLWVLIENSILNGELSELIEAISGDKIKMDTARLIIQRIYTMNEEERNFLDEKGRILTLVNVFNNEELRNIFFNFNYTFRNKHNYSCLSETIIAIEENYYFLKSPQKLDYLTSKVKEVIEKIRANENRIEDYCTSLIYLIDLLSLTKEEDVKTITSIIDKFRDFFEG